MTKQHDSKRSPRQKAGASKSATTNRPTSRSAATRKTPSSSRRSVAKPVAKPVAKRNVSSDVAGATPSAERTPPVDVGAILQRLEETYPDAGCELVHSSPFELLVATILSAQCTDERVNIVTGRLFPELNQPEHYAALPYEELAELIKDCGLFRSKARSIVDTSRILLDEHDGEVPRSRDELMKLPGVGRKTANVVMSTAFGTPAIAVDTHVFRVANRIGLADAKDTSKTEEQLMEIIPEALWSDTHHRLIHHGRRICSARRPKCHECPIEPFCRYAAEQRTSEAAAADVKSS